MFRSKWSNSQQTPHLGWVHVLQQFSRSVVMVTNSDHSPDNTATNEVHIFNEMLSTSSDITIVSLPNDESRSFGLPPLLTHVSGLRDVTHIDTLPAKHVFRQFHGLLSWSHTPDHSPVDTADKSVHPFYLV